MQGKKKDMSIPVLLICYFKLSEYTQYALLYFKNKNCEK